MGPKGWIGLASKDSKGRHRRAVASSGGEGRRRLQPATGLIAMSAVVLAASAASAASSTVHAAPAGSATTATPESGSADGGSPPAMDFPNAESHLASGRFVGGPAPVVGAGSGSIPSTVLAAYQRAVERTNMVQPHCHIPLELLAAIGKVESGHARGGRVDATGRTLTPILGPVLDGGAFAAIPDTDGGAYDGDKTWDRAVGPMQFIPGTWARWASDGNLDGRLDPHNVYDASLAAARYLCAANRDLGTPEGLDEAVLSYNHSTSYLALVRSWMAVYKNGTVSVADITDLGGYPPMALVSAPGTPAPPAPPPTSAAPTTPPPPPSTTPTTPPAPTTPPTTPPDPGTPPTDPSTTPTTPPTTDPTTPPASQEPTTQPPTTDPTQCGPLGGVGDLVGGLVGQPPNCVTPTGTPTTPTTTTTAAPTTTPTTTPTSTSTTTTTTTTPSTSPETTSATPTP